MASYGGLTRLTILAHILSLRSLRTNLGHIAAALLFLAPAVAQAQGSHGCWLFTATMTGYLDNTEYAKPDPTQFKIGDTLRGTYRFNRVAAPVITTRPGNYIIASYSDTGSSYGLSVSNLTSGYSIDTGNTGFSASQPDNLNGTSTFFYGPFITVGVYHPSISLFFWNLTTTTPIQPLVTDPSQLVGGQQRILSISAFGPPLYSLQAAITSISTCDSEVLDPITPQVSQSLIQGAHITSDPQRLAKGGQPVNGVAADGVTQVLVRTRTVEVGDEVTFQLQTCNGDLPAPTNCVDAQNSNRYGALYNTGVAAGIFDPIATGTRSFLSTFSVATGVEPMAFVAYRAPLNFSESPTSTEADMHFRFVFLKVSTIHGGSSAVTYSKLTVRRPPVILVHGMHSSPEYWDDTTELTSLTQAFKYTVYRLNYTEILDRFYHVQTLTALRENAMGIEYNAKHQLPNVQDFIQTFKAVHSVAAVQADAIGHSMGGLVLRGMRFEPGFFSSGKTYGQGYFHKILTLGTPHLGSSIASRMFDGTNTCFATTYDQFAPVISTRVVEGRSYNGAVGDLRGGPGYGVSDGIARIQKAPLKNGVAVPRALIAYLGGVLGAENFADLEKFNPVRNFARDKCGSHTVRTNFSTVPPLFEIKEGIPGVDFPVAQPPFQDGFVVVGNPLVDWYTKDRWNLIFSGAENDCLVDINSAFNGGSQNSSNTFTAAHGPGSVRSYGLGNLNFGGHFLQESASGAPARLRDLLETTIVNSIFTSLP